MLYKHNISRFLEWKYMWSSEVDLRMIRMSSHGKSHDTMFKPDVKLIKVIILTLHISRKSTNLDKSHLQYILMCMFMMYIKALNNVMSIKINVMLLLYSDLKFASFVCSIQKTIDRYKTYTREVVNNKTVQLDIHVSIYAIRYMTFLI
jgi:hypothetical protein